MINRFLEIFDRLYTFVFVSYYEKRKFVSFDERWFKNKRVAIVGGADSALVEKLGEYIDGFDVVVRINKGVELLYKQSDYLGTRTDILFHSFFDRPNDSGSSPLTPELWRENNIKLIIYADNSKTSSFSKMKLRAFITKTKDKFRFKCSQIPLNICEENRKVVYPSHATTGFAAINSIFCCHPSELYITGITFFRTPHNRTYRDLKQGTKKRFYQEGDHNADLEYEYVKKLYVEKPNVIIPDKSLQRIFESD